MSPERDTARLYEQYGEELYRFCLGRLKSPQEAEDAVQNTFIRVFRALEKDVEPEFELAWLYRIATNVCLSRQGLTSRRARWQSPQDVAELEVAAAEAEPDAARDLVDAVSRLPKNLRDAFLLREWRGLSYVEIADSLGTSVAAVETLLVRARRNLAAALRRGAAVVNPALLLRLRPSGAGAAPVAAGAAALALGGAVVGTQVGKADTHVPRPKSAPAPALVADLPVLHPTPVVSRVRAPTPARRAKAAAPRRHVVTAAPASLRTVTPVLRPPEPPDPGPQAAAPPPAPAPAAREAPPAANSPTATATATTTAVLALLPPPPAVTVPSLPPDPLPTVSIPTVTVPTVTVPAVGTVPSIHVP